MQVLSTFTAVDDVASLLAAAGVTWVHSYVSDDLRKTFCIYNGPSVDAVQAAAQRNSLPVDSIQPVTVFDPYFYRAEIDRTGERRPEPISSTGDSI